MNLVNNDFENNSIEEHLWVEALREKSLFFFDDSRDVPKTVGTGTKELQSGSLIHIKIITINLAL